MQPNHDEGPIAFRPIQSHLDQHASNSVSDGQADNHYAETSTDQSDSPQPPHGSLIERFLSPESLKRLMMCGGSLMILGFVIWLWTQGIFENPLIAACGIGMINLSILGIGMSLIRWTRYQLAGRGLTLLAALAMPLNLWFYDAQGLIVLDEGGQLWIPAALCCLIYAAVARLLRDSAFVYTFVGGIVMTGMLFLADTHVNRFWELLPQATFLSIVGWTCMLSQFLFAKGDGDFSQQRFGKSFHRAGSLVLLSGLGLILGGQLTIFLPEWIWTGTLPEIASMATAKWWGLSLIVGSSIALAVHAISSGSRSEFSLSGLCAIWAGLTVLNIMNLIPNLPQLTILAAIILIAETLWTFYQTQKSPAHTASSLGVLSLFSVFGLATLATIQFVAIHGILPNWHANPSWFFAEQGWVGIAQALAICLAAYTVGFRLSLQNTDPANGTLSQALFVLAGGLLTIAVWSECFLLGVSTLLPLVAAALGISALYGVANLFTSRGLLRNTTETVAGSHLIFSLALFTLNTLPLFHQHAMHAVILSAATVTAGLLSRTSKLNFLLSCLLGAAATLQAVLALGLDVGLALCSIPSIIGVATVLVDASRTGRSDGSVNGLANFGYSAMIAGSMAGVLMTLNRFVTGGVDAVLLATLVSQLAMTATFGFLSKSNEWRLALRATSIATALSTLGVVHELSVLDTLHRVELLTLLSSLGLLALGHATWAKEGERADGNATICLILGSLLLIVPLSVGLVFERFESDSLLQRWRLFHEIGALTAGMLLLGSGILCRIRWTTFAGTGLMGVYVISLLTLIPVPAQLQNLSIAMMVGGGIFFGSAILLSIYRDRIMEIPQKVKEGKGLFQVLHWR